MRMYLVAFELLIVGNYRGQFLNSKLTTFNIDCFHRNFQEFLGDWAFETSYMLVDVLILEN